MPETVEPITIPEPKTKPIPIQPVPEYEPDENDPWDIPDPGVQPQPKALLIKAKH